jgi:hypothetical protein
VGTKITLAKWQQYKRFLPVGIQAALSGDYTFHAGSGPEYTMVAGPTTHFSMPHRWMEDGEKYGGQVRLEPTRLGGFVMKGCVAGPPFPNPTEPNRGVKVLYNTWAPLTGHSHCNRSMSASKWTDKETEPSPLPTPCFTRFPT